jgi:hypothetical protein
MASHSFKPDQVFEKETEDQPDQARPNLLLNPVEVLENIHSLDEGFGLSNSG